MTVRRRDFMQWLGASVLVGAARPVASAARNLPAMAGRGELARMKILDRIDPIATAEYQDRIAAAQRRMRLLGFSALLLEPGSNMAYFTGLGFGRSERLVSTVIPVQGEPFFIAPAFEAAIFRGRQVVQEVVTWEEQESPYAKVFEALHRRDQHSGVLGVGPTSRLFVYQGLHDVNTNFEVKPGAGLVDPLRMRKSEHELQLMEAAIAVTEEAIRQTWKRVRAGITERELAGELRSVFQQLGSPGGGLVQFAATSAIPHGRPGDRKLAEGDTVLIDCGTKVEGYTSDITRTAVYREASPQVRKVWKIVRDAQQAAIDVAKPGISCQELDITARAVIEKAGYGKYFIHRLGHGLGLDGHEHPYLVRGNLTVLEPGITVTIEPGIYLPGEFGIRIEDDIVITEDGCRPLSNLVSTPEII